jgi:hypothetical protein
MRIRIQHLTLNYITRLSLHTKSKKILFFFLFSSEINFKYVIGSETELDPDSIGPVHQDLGWESGPGAEGGGGGGTNDAQKTAKL